MISKNQNSEPHLYDYLNIRIGAFSDYYRTTLSGPIRVNPKNAASSFQSLLNAVQQAGHPLYLLIDE